MLRAAAIACACSVACTFPSQGQDGAVTIDADPGTVDDVDAAPPADAAWPCVGAGVAVVCEPAPSGALVLADAVFDTSSDPRCLGRVLGGVEVCLVWAETITVTASVQVIGTRPLVLAAADELTTAVAARLDVSAYGALPGAGGNSVACGTPTAGEDDLGGGGGGAGGSFQGRGGDGGEGDLNDMARNGHGAPGLALAPIANAEALRGGCRGSNGGAGADDQNVPFTGGPGGAGGGAIALLAGSTITIGGGVVASGGGGIGAPFRAAGGGGGSGGMILLAAPVIAASGPLVANGGGGGESGVRDNNVWVTGQNGDNGLTAVTAAQGGDSPGPADGEGGDGSSWANPNASDGDSWDGGGGGGGGGAGFIYVYGELTNDGIISPPPIRSN
jgi:hypothetical protein